MKMYKIQAPEMLPVYVTAETAEQALRKVEQLTGPLPRHGLRVTLVPDHVDMEGESVL